MVCRTRHDITKLKWIYQDRNLTELLYHDKILLDLIKP